MASRKITPPWAYWAAGFIAFTARIAIAWFAGWNRPARRVIARWRGTSETAEEWEERYFG